MISERLYLERQRRLDALGSCPPWWKPFKRRAWRQQVARTMAMGITEFDEMIAHHYQDGRLADPLRVDFRCLRKVSSEPAARPEFWVTIPDDPDPVGTLISRVTALMTEPSTPLTWSADHSGIIANNSRYVMLDAIKRLIGRDVTEPANEPHRRTGIA
jgi:hypothetical protein